MVMLTLARFVLEKTGGDSMAEVDDNLRRYRERIAADARAAGRRRTARGRRGRRVGRRGQPTPTRGEAGSGGDD